MQMEEIKSEVLTKADENKLKLKKMIEFNPKDVKMDLRARWKCRFGCEYYGRASCPPNVPEFDECVKFVRSYKTGLAVIFKFDNYMDEKRKAQKMLIEIESKLVLNHPFAFVLFPGGCDICEVCDGKKCKTFARPSVSAMCIDISSFQVNFGDGSSVGVILID